MLHQCLWKSMGWLGSASRLFRGGEGKNTDQQLGIAALWHISLSWCSPKPPEELALVLLPFHAGLEASGCKRTASQQRAPAWEHVVVQDPFPAAPGIAL